METFTKRLVMVVGALLVLIYVGYQIFMAAYSPVKLETVELYDEYETVDAEGLIVREETLIPRTQEGFVYYNIDNGNRVAKGGCIADLYPDQEAAVTQQKIKELTAEIEELESIQEQGQNTRTNLEIITTQLKKMQTEIISASSSPSVSGCNELSHELLSVMNKQQITIGRVSDFETQLAALRAQRDALLQKGTVQSGAVYAPTAGYFVNAVDGLESAIAIDTIASITTADIRAAMDAAPQGDNSSYIGKVIGSYEWYLVCIVPASQMTSLAPDSRVQIRLPFVSGETIPVTLVAENRDREGNMAVVFCCDYMSADLSDIRSEQVQILVKKHSGLRVPDEAVHFNDAGEPGVYVRVGNMLVFKRIRVEYHSDKEPYSICAIVNESGYLKVYDDVVIEGKDLYDGKIV